MLHLQFVSCQPVPCRRMGCGGGADGCRVLGARTASPHSLGDMGLAKALTVMFTAGLIWQSILRMTLVAREQHTLRWSVVREALWLRAPTNAKTGRRGGRLWFVVLPLIFGFAAEELIPTLPHAANRDFGGGAVIACRSSLVPRGLGLVRNPTRVVFQYRRR